MSNPDGPPAVRQVTFQFDATMSEADVRRDMNRLLALGARFNKLLQELQDTISSPLSVSEQEANALRAVIEFLESDQAVLEAGFVTKLLRPFLGGLTDNLVRVGSIRSNGTRTKPAIYTRISSLPRGYLIAAWEVLKRSGMQKPEIMTWLKKHNVADPTQVFEWRNETVVRMASKRPTDAPIDVVADTYVKLCPPGWVGASRDEAVKLAKKWIAEAEALRELLG